MNTTIVLFGHSLRELVTDCFEGQIITVSVVVVFVAAYLFREWVIQNTPAEAALELVAEDADEPDGPWINREMGNEDRQRLAQQQVAVDTLLNAMRTVDVPDQVAQEEREQISERLEEIRRTLDRKRRAAEAQIPDDDAQMHFEHFTAHRSARDIESPSIHADYSEANEEQTASSLYSRSNTGTSFGNDTPAYNGDNSQSSDVDYTAQTYSHQSIWEEPENGYWSQRETGYHEYANSANTSEPTASADGKEKGKGKARDDRNGSPSSTPLVHEESYDADDDENANERERSNVRDTFSSWKNEHSQVDEENGSSSKIRWRAPEFSTLPGPNDPSDEDKVPDPSIEIPTRVPPARQGIPAFIEPQPLQNLQLVNDVREEQENNNEEVVAQGDEGFDLGDDIEGVLEAIGMRGNPWMLIQNSVLMALMISLCLAVAVWIPYVVGRVVILIRPISFIQTPIYILRLVTDPVVDFVLDSAVPFAWSVIASKPDIVPEKIRIAIWSLVEYITGGVEGPQLDGGMSGSGVFEDSAHTMSSDVLQNVAADWYQHVQQKIEEAGVLILNRWHQFALGSTGLDRTVCTVVGYLVMVFLGSWYIGRSSTSRRRATGNSFNEIIRQQGVFLKVFFFIVLELVVFPTICGALLDLATLPLFNDASLSSRWAFVQQSPYSGCFLHWFVGTGFMFHFAVFVTLCREVVRPGVMWFIRDPNDPQFHPVQEMIERPVFTLLRKISSSAVMYSTLIVMGIGSVTVVVSSYSSIYPLRWSFGAPLSTLAIDFLVAQFLLPPLISYINPREFAKKALSTWWRATSAHLRLTSFMFNGRYADEEGTHVRRDLKAWLLWQKAPISSAIYADVAIEDENAPVIFRRDGQLIRVPKHDSVPVHPNRRMLVPVDPITLEAIDETERRNGHPAASESGDEEHSTTVVYIPPHFRLRVRLV
ncbi:hypothetical protein DFQ30_003160 [Apophysomyces sp. BC1015]|nr:hypothetical protein DFQ30_003160 [Apophysomyces sp. BC1015]KAG0182166.1 hypothetical protein DFQ29_005526 [Apophysomyces sp. BC1021]